MASGDLCVELTEAGTWESFPRFAEKWAEEIGAEITDRLDGPDVRIWTISYEGHSLSLVYDDFPNGVTVEAPDSTSNATIEKLFAIVSSQSDPNGV
jgi:hypothetical protein